MECRYDEIKGLKFEITNKGRFTRHLRGTDEDLILQPLVEEIMKQKTPNFRRARD